MSMLQKSKDPLGFVVSISKVANLQGYFDLSNFYKKEMDIRAFDFEVAVQLQIEVKQNMLGRSVTFKPQSVENRPLTVNLF